jgi:phosphotriesterase-related protein
MMPDVDTPPYVQTVLGPVAAADLGPTLPHEHLLLDLRHVTFAEPAGERERALAREPLGLGNLGWIRRHWTSSLDNLVIDDEALVIRELAAYRDAGGRAIVDATVPGIGRDPEALARISRATGLHVVMGAGYYVAPSHPADVLELDEDAMADRVVREWADGVDGTGIRPGFIGEVGCSWPLHPRERRALRAMAVAQRRTGLAMMVHPGRDPGAVPEILAILTAAGADLSRLVIAHLDRGIVPLAELAAMARDGTYVELDCFGLESSWFPPNPRLATLSDAQRLDIVRGLLDAGVGDRVLLAHDVCQKHRLAAYGGHGFGHLMGEVVPWMHQRGFTEAETNLLVVENPARAFALGRPAGTA